MENYYEILGLRSSATADEIRRAYRILARRYHPDVNPANNTEERFKKIAEAYRTLNDPQKRKAFDVEFEVAAKHRRPEFRAYQRSSGGKATDRFHRAQEEARNKNTTRRKAQQRPSEEDREPGAFDRFFNSAAKIARSSVSSLRQRGAEDSRIHEQRLRQISVIEVSVTVEEAIRGLKKSVEIQEPDSKLRKVSVQIPAGVRTGSVVHLRSKGSESEDLVIIVRVAYHPFISLQPKGIVVEIPISIEEAICGARLKVPTLDEATIIKIPEGSQSGDEIRLRDKGTLNKDGSHGDIFYKLLVKVPESTLAVGIKEQATDISKYYENSVRSAFPDRLLS